MSNDVKVSVRNLTKCFGDLKVLDNISFDIKRESLSVSSARPAAARQPSSTC